MVNLKVPYCSQLDNVYSPMGTCSLTSVSMVMKFYGVVGNGQGQLEDQLYQIYGDRRWYPETMAEALASKGIKDNFRQDATIEDIKKHLDSGNPCIIHTYLTASGHIVVIRGYDDTGLFINDPYGEYFPEGYDTGSTGENLHYSYDLIKRTSQDDKGIWVHFVSK